MPASGLWLESWSLKPLGAGSSVLSSKGFLAAAGTAACTNRTKHVCGFVYKSSRRRMIQGSVQACSESPAMGGPSLSPHQSSAHPGLLNLGGHTFEEGYCSRRVGLHPESVRMIWTRYGRVEVDLFTTSKNAHCPLFFYMSHSPLKGDRLTSHWPAARLYAFPPIIYCHWCYARSERRGLR